MAGGNLLVALVSATRIVLACRLVSGVHHAALESLFLVLTSRQGQTQRKDSNV